MRILSAILAASMTLTTPVTAASVASQTGRLLVNTGDGFKAAGGAADVAPGGQIMVRDGTATIAYSSTCSVLVGPGRVWTVASTAPCKDGVSSVDMTTASYNGGPAAWDAVVQPPPFNPMPLLIGAAVIGGGAALVVGLSGGDDKKNPASAQ